jgi:hypothetical protein
MTGADLLRHPPNHQQNWGLVQIIDLSSDEQLRDRSHRRCVENGASRDELHGVVTLREGVVDIAQLLK